MNIILVTGGRNFHEKKFINSVLSEIHEKKPIDILIHGNAVGVDKLCGMWSVQNQINTFVFPAKWKFSRTKKEY